ncbi:hypothetical protein A3C89_03210 [Candidatus Kaiserbacteria bacterium RIFCSPHIGHO2_02_FULL_50_50]|uniref:HTH cro/C1-type domain-containing protein n=1 Tax=Candidatus Kaiserbacteria bacterium RIFCSPHIGHO2_02_FULL_50_50 TaxID=1798492 RepID=A0A1F6DES6_9BACT|nr:MAG: hypothetical protein A3C89_03210 [Candidatus Kaiserbacteria bacterium RIFCSPHIGHO2_02_FULL_50_50]OGG88105.1 MAG: hypothetical protein A3G62_02425 [Candidatus Kaiserbacteria bacterium RIFCSPLOWO2_12_FULL_50_10]
MKKASYKKEYVAFAQRLRAARLEAGLTQVELAHRLKRPQSYVSNIESGQQRLDVVELKYFAEVCEKPVTYFIEPR